MSDLAHNGAYAPSGPASGAAGGGFALDGASRRLLGDVSLFVAAMSGGFVIFEPAPYELLMVGLMGAFFLVGLKVTRSSLPLLALMTLFSLGGVMGMFQLNDPGSSYVYIAVTFFLGLTAWFFALVVAEDPYRLRIIMLGTIWGAVLTAFLGIAGYFDAIPGSDLFLRYGRAKGAFQDPNVLAPFLVLPAAWLWHGILTRSASMSLVRAAALFVLLLGIFLAFSRAGWGLIVFALAGVYALAFLHNRAAAFRLRLLILAALAGVGMVLALVIALQIPAIADLFSSRAQLVQEYDGGELGRFQRHWLGFMLAVEKPFGIGRSEFAKLYTEDPHNIWLKCLMVYGWLGFVSFLIITALTIKRGFSLLFLDRPWTPYLQICWVVFVGHIVMAWVIDIDHWRHVFMLFGLLWGMFALEINYRQHERREARLFA
ncbi:MAG: O-antigen ligase family protein [Pseudomonadota bacterium]